MWQSQQLLKIPCEFCAALQLDSLAGTNLLTLLPVSGVAVVAKCQDMQHQPDVVPDLMHVGGEIRSLLSWLQSLQLTFE